MHESLVKGPGKKHLTLTLRICVNELREILYTGRPDPCTEYSEGRLVNCVIFTIVKVHLSMQWTRKRHERSFNTYDVSTRSETINRPRQSRRIGPLNLLLCTL